MKPSEMNRRRFLKAGALGLASVPLVSGCRAPGEAKSTPPPAKLAGTVPAKEARIVQYNTLGKTGLEVSDISLGGATEAPVFRYALERGVNLYDTAEQYFQGQHEAYLGAAFKDVRDQVIVITKHLHGFSSKISKKDVVDRFDASLRRMGFDYVDIAMIHHLADPETLRNEELLDAYETLRKAGKYRYLGFSTHDMEAICPAAFDSGLFSVMLVIYNSVQYPERSGMITRAKELGIGVLAMKTMAGRQQDRIKSLVNDRTTFSRAAMKWALTDPGVTSVLISMRTFEHIDEYLPASGERLDEKDLEVLNQYAAAVDHDYCRIGCARCERACPNRVAVNDIMRFGMYFENYGEERKAMLEYGALPGARRAASCAACSAPCERACPHGLAVKDRLLRYHGLLLA